MKNRFAVTALVFGLSLPALGMADKEPFLTELKEVFLPSGYDTDDTVEIMTLVELPDSCHRITAIDTQVTRASRIRIGVWVKDFGGECHQGPIPIVSTLSLGRLRTNGFYRIVDQATEEVKGEFLIALASPPPHGTDENLYPPLTDAYLELQDGKNMLVLRGTYSDICQSFRDVTFSTTKNVLVAIPILDHPEGEDCTKGITPFEERFEVTVDLPKGNFLLHVRASGGISFNKMNFAPPVK